MVGSRSRTEYISETLALEIGFPFAELEFGDGIPFVRGIVHGVPPKDWGSGRS